MWEEDWAVSQSPSCCSSPHGQAMYTERGGGGWLTSLAREEGRVALAGVGLVFLHTAGLVVSLYMLVSHYLAEEPDHGDPYYNVCSDVVLCILFRFGPGRGHTGETNTALAGQLLFSLLAIAVNLGLVCGALGGRLPVILLWLIFYMLNILGSLVLTGIMAATLAIREKYYEDIEQGEFAWIIVPVLLAVLYSILWTLVFHLYLKLRRKSRILYTLET